MSETETCNFREPLEFLDCLHFAIVNSEYTSIILKPKQVLCLEAAFLGKDLLAVLPTGYGKSLVFHLLSSLLAEKKRRSGVLEKTVVIVIFPLNSLIPLNSLHNQLKKINRLSHRAAVLSVQGQELGQNNVGEQSFDYTNINESRLKNADYEYIFTHPETCLSTKYGASLFQTSVYKYSVAAIVVDEAHCIVVDEAH